MERWVMKKNQEKKRKEGEIECFYQVQAARPEAVRCSVFVVLFNLCALSIPGAKMQLRRAAREHTLVEDCYYSRLESRLYFCADLGTMGSVEAGAQV